MAISAQLSNLIRWALAFIVIYMLLPTIIFPTLGDNTLERFFSRYTRMVAVTIVSGYILVAFKLYEVLSLFLVFLILKIIVKFYSNNRKFTLQEMNLNAFTLIFDILDDPTRMYQVVQQFFNRVHNRLKDKISEYFSLDNCFQAFLLLGVLAYSMYLRFYDTLRHAAPSMSDAYVWLAWTKYIDGRFLFHDGIYPQGFAIYLSILHKFAACDVLYILKYSGPLTGVLTTLGIYMLIAKVSGRKLPGIISAFVFGVLGGSLPYDWQRQGASLPQEFAFFFLIVAWYYALSFLQTRSKQHLWTATAAFGVIAFVHSLVLAYLWLGLTCIFCAYLLLNFRQTINPVGQLIKVGIVTGLVAALPVPIAWLAGKRFHEISLEYMTRTAMQAEIPALTLIDLLALGGFAFFLVISIWKRKDGSDLAMSLSIFLLGVSTFLMYLFLGPLTGKVLLIARLGGLWSLLAAMGVGLLVGALLKLIPSRQNNWSLRIAPIIALFLMIWSVILIKPLPALPYKMQYDAEINQYLRIVDEFPRADWTLVSPIEGYQLALGTGWHINTSDFLKWYDPQKSKLVNNIDRNAEPFKGHMFILYQKQVFQVKLKEMESKYTQRIQEYADLEKWVSMYRQKHDNLKVYYQDDFIEIYHIYQKAD